MIGKRKTSPVVAIGPPLHFPKEHFKAVSEDGRKFLYCPIGNICSWSEGDYDHNWCHWCKKFLSEAI